ncbi:hypothetical protein ACFW9O_33795 [Streptomyces sp. NPDC059499]|uniref:hypothetical protein n=1 Tax=Streptomyces sp. NPDC059499 TaxID=3346852 RepID=UPI00369BED57
MDIAAAREAAVASGLAHNRAREVIKEHLIGTVTSTLKRGTAEALAHIDAQIAGSTSLDLDAEAEADLQALGFDGAPAADPAEMFDADTVRTLAATVAGELRAQAAAHPGDLLAVICANARLGDMTSTGVTRWARLVPASEARGLEFDASIVVGPQEIVEARPSGERDLYVALTCATKRLCSIAVQPA